MATEAQIEQDWELVAELAADLHDAHARLVRLVARALDQDTWAAPGIRSPEHWLMVRAGLSRGQAAAVVLLARRQEDLPATAAALDQGAISLDQAAVVARHTPSEFDATVAEFARHATVTQLHRTVSRYDFTLEPHSHDPEGRLLPAQRPEPHTGAPTGPDGLPALQAPATLSMGFTAEGRFRLRYEAPPEQGALVQAALTEAKDHLFHTTSPDTPGPDTPSDAVSHPTSAGGCEGVCGGQARSGCDDRTGPQAVDGCGTGTRAGRPRITWADAFTLIATRSLDTRSSPSRRARYRVNVFLDTDGGWLTGTPRLPRHLIDGLTCDGTLTPVWTTRGHPVNVGDTQRVVPARSRVLVLDRDRGCRFPGCGASSHLEVHHLTHWRDGGPTDLPNLLSLCPHHHDGHHRGEYTITGDPTRADGLEFHTRTGLSIGPPERPPHPPLDQPPPRPLQQPCGQPLDQPPDRPLERPPGHREHPADPPEDPAPDPIRDRRDPAGLRPVPADTAAYNQPIPTDRSRPRARLGRSYAAPTGGTLHLNLVDFTPPRRSTVD